MYNIYNIKWGWFSWLEHRVGDPGDGHKSRFRYMYLKVCKKFSYLKYVRNSEPSEYATLRNKMS